MDLIPPQMPAGGGGEPPDPSVVSSAAGDNGLATGTPADMQDAASISTTGAPNTNPTPAATDDDGSIKPTPEEQQQYNQFVTRAKTFIHGKGSRDSVLKMLSVPGTPAYENIGRTASNIVQMIESSAQSSGQQLSQDALFHGGMAVVADLLNVGVKSGVFGKVDPKQIPHLYQLSVLAAMKHYGNATRGQQDPNQARGLLSSMVGQEHADGQGTPASMNLVSAGVKAALAAGGRAPAGGT